MNPVVKLVKTIKYKKLDIPRRKKMFTDKLVFAQRYNKTYNAAELTKEDIAAIDTYWAQFGIKFEDYSWFRWFYSVTGKKDPKFMPNDVYAHIVWPYYNNVNFYEAWKDKNFFDRFLPDVKFPKTVLKRINGSFYDSDFNYYSDDDFEALAEILKAEGVVIVKDTWDSGEGRGVKKYTINTDDDVRKLLNDWKSDNFIVQEVIKQNDCFAQFNESSVNIMRISSWYHDGKVEILSPTLRVGTEGFTTDVCYINGEEIANVLGITMDGHFKEYIVAQNGVKTPIKERVPNPDVKIPRWDDIIEMVKKNHPKLGHFDIVGWDFTVTPDNEIICIEYNVQRPGTVFYQYVHGPFFGEHTDAVLSFLKNPKNREKYVPEWLKA